jgi:uncharacterized repeat protein (TIGR03803 family)
MKKQGMKGISMVMPGIIWAALVAYPLLAARTASAQTETVLWNFNNTSDYGYPEAPVIADSLGNLYGTASSAGPGTRGGVFELSPPAVSGGSWTETMLFSFDGGADGGSPQGGLVMDASGNLYGTTSEGGDADGDGVVFELSPPATEGGTWTETILHTFNRVTDGDAPTSGLVFDASGNLYGEASGGGPGSGGNVFKMNPPATSGGSWTLTVLHNFNSSSSSTAYAGGCNPETGVTIGSNGVLYGTTPYCGANAGGVAFQLSPPTNGHTTWQEIVLHTFGPPNRLGDGALPRGGVTIGKGGVLFGCTNEGGKNYGGIAYELLPPVTSGGAWTEKILFSFTGGTVGYQAVGNLVLNSNGALYGATTGSNLYKLTPPTNGGAWTETVLATFSGGTGFEAMSGPLLYKGALYGTTSLGGSGFGIVYEVAF